MLLVLLTATLGTLWVLVIFFIVLYVLKPPSSLVRVGWGGNDVPNGVDLFG